MKFFLAVVIGTYDESLFTGDAIKIIMSMAEYFEAKYVTSNRNETLLRYAIPIEFQAESQL